MSINFHYLLKYVIIGDSGVGKSNILLQYINGKFNEDFKLKVDELCTQKIIQESTEMIVYCKPMMNSAASKTLMKEYSESKRYK